jgi:WD40 repeat protein
MQGTGANRPPLFHIKMARDSSKAHTASVTAVEWYAIDNGLFVSGSKDRTVKLWDPNCVALVTNIAVLETVAAVRPGLDSGQASIVAAGCSNGCVQLVDILQGSAAQTLSGSRNTGGSATPIRGHNGSVLCLDWSKASNFQLVAGDSSGQILVWDIRRAGVLHSFDLEHTMGDDDAEMVGRQDDIQYGSGRYSQAHRGAVTGLLQTGDGQWVSAGTDNAVRLWSAVTHRNCLVRYPEAFNSTNAARQLALDSSSQVCT